MFFSLLGVSYHSVILKPLHSPRRLTCTSLSYKQALQSKYPPDVNKGVTGSAKKRKGKPKAMEKVPTATRDDGSANPGKQKSNNKKSKRMPTPRELVSHYENQGMETQEASLKVIQDLQGALFRIVAANRNPKSPNLTSDKLDAIHSRLLHLERKLDAKPSYPQALALGVVSAGIWNATLQIWNSVRGATSSSNPY